MRQFLLSSFTPAMFKFKTMREFASFKNDFQCVDLAYVDKLVKDNNGVKYLLVPHDLFDRTVDTIGLKRKDCKESVVLF